MGAQLSAYSSLQKYIYETNSFSLACHGHQTFSGLVEFA